MKTKFYMYTIIILITSLVCGCVKKEENVARNIYTEDEIIDKYNIAADYDFKNAEKDGFVIYNNTNKIINNNKVKDFYENTINNIDATLTIIRYTIEGDPIIIQYNYTDGKFIVYEDTTRDKYGEKKIIMREIKNIELKEENNIYEIIEKY